MLITVFRGVKQQRLIAACMLALSALPLSTDASLAAHQELSTTVVSATVPGPEAASSFTAATSGPCPGHDVLIGGGMRGAGTNSNALHLNATAPVTTRAPKDTTWTGIGATGDQPATGATTTSFAMCLGDGPRHIRVVENTVDGPSAANSWTRTTATCPSRFVLVGGGARTEPPTAGSLKPIGSFPSDAAGNPLATGSTDPTAWTAVGLNGGQAAPGAVTHAFALCAHARRMATQVFSMTSSGPVTASTLLTTTVACPTRGATVLLGGGAFSSAATGAIPQTGVHLRAVYPSDAAGNPVLSGSAGAWTEVTQSGGMPAPGTQSTAFVLCANPLRTNRASSARHS